MARFRIIAAIVGDLQGRAVATLFYFTVLVPFAVGSRLFTDPLFVRAGSGGWHDRPAVSDDLDEARRQG
jgi:hypothetical protein